MGLKPAQVSFEAAAAVPTSCTALEALRTAGSIEPGRRVLIIGVCSTTKVVARALLTRFEAVNSSIATMAAWFRVAYAAVYLVAILQLVLALGLLDDPASALRAIDA